MEYYKITLVNTKWMLYCFCINKVDAKPTKVRETDYRVDNLTIVNAI